MGPKNRRRLPGREVPDTTGGAATFLSPASLNFLTPVFSKTTPLAQYNGVCQAASLVHDDHIGLGRHFHLYRLPESTERRISSVYHDSKSEDREHTTFSDTSAAMAFLEQFASGQVERSEGPVIVGDFSDSGLERLLRQAAAHYFKAFSDGYRSYPYIRMAE
jgi:hypothetical protein